MRKDIVVEVKGPDRSRLEAIVADRNSPQKHAWRARIVLLTGEGLGTVEIMRRTGKSKTCVWRWQERFMAAGVDGLLRDKTRPSRVPPLGAQVAEKVVALTQSEPPSEATHWTGRGSFPTDEAALKLLFLAIRNAGLRWRRPIEWTAAVGQFAILFGDRFEPSAR